MTPSKKTFSLYEMCSIAIFTAVICILAQIAIPMPSGVPFTLQTFAVTLTAVILGGRKGSLALLIYLLLGAVGLPVFSGFKGGLHSFAGPTGGFLLSFPLMALSIGYGADHRRKRFFYPIMLSIGIIINFCSAVCIYCITTGISPFAALFVCVIPFLPTTILFTVLASFLGFQIKKRLCL